MQWENKRMGTGQSIGNEVTDSWARVPVRFCSHFSFSHSLCSFSVLVTSDSGKMVRYNETVSATSLDVNLGVF